MPQYPLPKFHFRVEWGGADIGFTEISGLEVSTDVIEYREGSNPSFSKVKMPGIIKFNNVTMKRGIFKGNNEFYAWWNSNALNTAERRDIIIPLLNERHEPVVVWKLMNAFAVKIQSTDLKADGNEVAIETMEIAHEGLTIQNE